jgi:hypothetical protein
MVPANALWFFAMLAILNLAWEAAQLPFYTIWQDGTRSEIGFAVAHCTAGDVLIGLFSAGAAFILAGMRWPRDARARIIFTACFIAFGLTYTVFSEWLNVVVRKSWAYSALMPVIPPLDTGLAPLLQWIVVPILASWLTYRRGAMDGLLPSGRI